MKGLEQMIARIKQQLYMGRKSAEVYDDLMAQGVNAELAQWALRAAQFEIDQDTEEE